MQNVFTDSTIINAFGDEDILTIIKQLEIPVETYDTIKHKLYEIVAKAHSDRTTAEHWKREAILYKTLYLKGHK